MKKNGLEFLNKTLGNDFLKSLGNSLSKSEVYKQGSRTVTDTNDLFQGLQIVPKALLNLLIRELLPMQIDENKQVIIPGVEDTILQVTKMDRDSFSGQVIQNNVKLYDFMNRSVPGLGMVLLSILELYDPELLEEECHIEDSKELEINKLIDDRMQLHTLINKVVDGKMMERDAVNQLIMSKLSELIIENKKDKEVPSVISIPVVKPVEPVKPLEAPKLINKSEKKALPLKKFLDYRKGKKKEFSIEMSKSETRDCPDCGQNIFNGSGISSCICFGESKKIFLKKTENGIKISFGPKWDLENIEMLLDVLRGTNNE